MATMSIPQWTASDGTNQIKTFPDMTAVAFSVRPRTGAVGFVVHYKLISNDLEFTIPPAAGEPQGCSPAPPALNAVSRTKQDIDDEYRTGDSQQAIVRLLDVTRTSTATAGITTVEITVADIMPGHPNPAHKSAMISF